MVERREALVKLFSAKGSRINTNRGEEYYDSLKKTMTQRLNELEQMPAVTNASIEAVLDAEGITRRDFLKWASAACAAMMLPAHFTPLYAKAVELVNRLPVIDREGLLVGIVTRADLVRAFVHTDDQIGREIRDEVLLHELWLDPRNFELRVEEGVVEIAGRFESDEQRDIVARRLRLVPGVVAVVVRETTAAR